jgi:uncharacterized membrane protein YvbJ
MFCTSCSKELPSSAKFCKYCGAKQASLNNSAVKKFSEDIEQAKLKKSRKIAILLVVLFVIGIAYFANHQTISTSNSAQINSQAINSNNENVSVQHSAECAHFLGEEAYDEERKVFLEKSIKKYCPPNTNPYWK